MPCYFYPLAYKFPGRTACTKSESVTGGPKGKITRSNRAFCFVTPLMALWRAVHLQHLCRPARFFVCFFHTGCFEKIAKHLIGSRKSADCAASACEAGSAYNPAMCTALPASPQPSFYFFFKCVFHLTFRRFTAKLFYLWVPLPAVRSAGWKAAV